MNNQTKRPYFLTFLYYPRCEYPTATHIEEQREGESIEELKQYALKLWGLFHKQWPDYSWGCIIQENFLPNGNSNNFVACYTKPEDMIDGLRWYTEGYHVWKRTIQDPSPWKDI